jgi:hypothetical protein
VGQQTRQQEACNARERAAYSRLRLLIIIEDSRCGTETVKVTELDTVQVGFCAVMADFDLRGHRQEVIVIVDGDVVVVHAE